MKITQGGYENATHTLSSITAFVCQEMSFQGLKFRIALCYSGTVLGGLGEG